jgi:hypothetical protein
MRLNVLDRAVTRSCRHSFRPDIAGIYEFHAVSAWGSLAPPKLPGPG